MPLITRDLNLALDDLQQGKPVAIPTETVYGLAAIITHDEAIRAVFAMKNRPLNHPLIVHIAENYDLCDLVSQIPDYAAKLMAHFWPGPLTLVLPASSSTSPLITGGQTTVAIRCPAHPIAQELLKKINIPLVAPSANPFGKVSPTTAEHVAHSFPDETLVILDGGRCTIGIESTIIDATHPEDYQILRHGMIDEQAIAQVIATHCSNKENTIRVPGKLDSHYQPEKTLYYFDSTQIERFCTENEGLVYLIASRKPTQINSKHFHLFAKQPGKAAFDLYYQLRKADESDVLCIGVELPPETSEWQGVRERILKAGRKY